MKRHVFQVVMGSRWSEEQQPAHAFYIEALKQLSASDIPFLVGGAFAMARHSGIERDTKDLDLFVMPADVHRTLRFFADLGYRTDLTFPHWLGKVYGGGAFIDVIFSSGNGVARVDERWFVHAVDSHVLGVPVQLCPPEEMIWSKAFVQERERFDGADVVHLFYRFGAALDWERLLERFGPHWRVLLGHIVSFGFVYPDQRHRIPAWLTSELANRLVNEHSDADHHVCQGTLLSREQYLQDVLERGYDDARLTPSGGMTPEELEIWNAEIETKH